MSSDSNRIGVTQDYPWELRSLCSSFQSHNQLQIAGTSLLIQSSLACREQSSGTTIQDAHNTVTPCSSPSPWRSSPCNIGACRAICPIPKDGDCMSCVFGGELAECSNGQQKKHDLQTCSKVTMPVWKPFHDQITICDKDGGCHDFCSLSCAKSCHALLWNETS